jgi:hypothetical protein
MVLPYYYFCSSTAGLMNFASFHAFRVSLVEQDGGPPLCAEPDNSVPLLKQIQIARQLISKVAIKI